MKAIVACKQVLAALWIVGGLVVLWRAGVAHAELLGRPEPFQISQGPEQSVLIFEFVAIYAFIEGSLQLVSGYQAFWLRKALTAITVFGSFIWLLLGGFAYEPWYFASAIAALLVASVWSVALPQPRITPNSTIKRDARKSRARPSL